MKGTSYESLCPEFQAPFCYSYFSFARIHLYEQ
uniref:Uncharacterized protein n=1 Tax=Siphoviridae sp. ctv2R2 TaxID=2823609 RepID=A0A8S5LAK4_9CAUD|nr:MAG TPA: hypothetical protein [Siphoviridae sp. ctv2R2]